MEKDLKQQSADCLKIVIFGPESTGKSTLASGLAAYFNTVWVPEYMRDYAQDKWNRFGRPIDREDLLPIAAGQMISENRLALSADELLFCDTDLLQLQIYAEYYNDGYCPQKIKQAAENATYDLYLLMNVDIPWVEDDLRDRPDERFTLFRIFEEALKDRKLRYEVVSGDGEERLKSAIELVNTLRKSRNAR